VRWSPLATVAIVAVGPMIGCRHDAEVDAFVQEYDALSVGLVADLDGAKGAGPGMDAARARLDRVRDDLMDRWARLGKLRQYEVGSAARDRLQASLDRDARIVHALEIKYRGEPGVDDLALAQLIADFDALTK
jgi:hypothetical protein